MQLSNYQPGTSFQVILPKIIPAWMNDAPIWWDSIQQLNNQWVTITQAPESGEAIWTDEDGNPNKSLNPERRTKLFVEIKEHECCICIDWLDDPQIACNCEVATLLLR